ncbi:MAG: 50S ribosomal protein L17 [Chitinispirillaceae bacterium]|nr:50S ribosomal protein L17 [Chitinispirillaceae bacterium]
MRHLVKGRKLNRTASHRRAMLSNLAISILDKERVETTLPKAKEVRRVVERLITYAKKDDLHSRRLAAVRINDPDVLRKLFAVIAPVYKDRNGGYVRIIKTRQRKGDNAPMAIIELVGIGGADTVRRRRKKKKAEQGPGTAKTTSAPAREEKAADGPK